MDQKEQPAATPAKGPASYTQAVQDVGALLRGEKPKRPDAGDKAKASSNGAGDDKASEGDDDARNKGNGADPDKGEAHERLAHDADAGGEGRGDGVQDPDRELEHDEESKGERIGQAELAKALGVKEGELFENLSIDVEQTDADGKRTRGAVSLGELRRGYVGAEKLRTEREAFEQERETSSLETMQSRRYFERIAHSLAPYLPRDVIGIVQQDQAARLERERVLMYAAIPEWKDAAKHAADRKAMIDYLRPWGFTSSDVAAIEDHRVARFVRDMMQGARRLRDAEERSRKAKQTGGASAERPTPAGNRPSGLAVRVRSIIEQGKAAPTAAGKIEAVASLLREHAAGGSPRRER